MLDAEIPERALAVYGHPDDPEIAVGGTLAWWADAGTTIWVVITTRGDKGSADPHTDRGADPAPEGRDRRRVPCCWVSSATCTCPTMTASSRTTSRLRAEIAAVVRELRPEAVLTPDPSALFFGDTYVNHRDHRMTGYATLDAISPAAGNPLYFPEQLRAGLEPHQVPRAYLSGMLAERLDRHRPDDRAQDRRPVLPPQPVARCRRLVRRSCGSGRAGGPRPWACASRRASAASPSPEPAARREPGRAPRAARDRTGGSAGVGPLAGGVTTSAVSIGRGRHRARARSATTATTAAPSAPTTAPTSAPMPSMTPPVPFVSTFTIP